MLEVLPPTRTTATRVDCGVVFRDAALRPLPTGVSADGRGGDEVTARTGDNY